MAVTPALPVCMCTKMCNSNLCGTGRSFVTGHAAQFDHAPVDGNICSAGCTVSASHAAVDPWLTFKSFLDAVMESLLFARETGGFGSNKNAHAVSIQHSISSSEALIRRLTNHKQLNIAGGSSGGALCCSWDDAGVQLAVGTDTCQLLIYNADKGKFTHTFDPVSNSALLWVLHGCQEAPFTPALLLLPGWSCRVTSKGLLVQSFSLGLAASCLSQLGQPET